MAWVLRVLQRNEESYPLFNLFSHAIAFAVMLPATFLAGMTLPLFTHVLMRGGHGERAIGQVYSANTLGAIAGVLARRARARAGDRHEARAGARRGDGHPARRLAAALFAGGAAARPGVRRADHRHARGDGRRRAPSVLEPERLSSGVFRYGHATHADSGRSSSTATARPRRSRCGATANNSVGIITNGKPDAAIQMDPDRRPHRRRVHDGHRGRAAAADQARGDALRQHRLRLGPHGRGAAVAQRAAGSGHDRDRAGHGVRRALLHPARDPALPRPAQQHRHRGRQELLSPATASATT